LVRVTVARSAGEIEPLRPAWEKLYSQSCCTIFQSYAWNRLAAQVFARRAAPFVVFAESDSGAALLPAALSRHQITFLGDELFDYRDLLFAGDPDIARSAWAQLARLNLPLTLKSVRGEAARRRWQRFDPQSFAGAPQIAAAECTAQALAAAHRRLGRFWRRALRSGAQLLQYDGSASALLRWIYEKKATQFGPCPGSLFCDRRRVDFMVAAGAADPAACDIFTLESNGQVMSALVTFRDRQMRRFYTVFYDQQFAEFSPGNILLFEICRRTLEQGMSCDLMTGEQPYKLRLATSAVPLFQIEASAEVVAAAGRTREPITEVAA
jgi:CelD/BcsL family acetyltransferase involved in cellulose biosynthesis